MCVHGPRLVRTEGRKKSFPPLWSTHPVEESCEREGQRMAGPDTRSRRSRVGEGIQTRARGRAGNAGITARISTAHSSTAPTPPVHVPPAREPSGHVCHCPRSAPGCAPPASGILTPSSGGLSKLHPGWSRGLRTRKGLPSVRAPAHMHAAGHRRAPSHSRCVTNSPAKPWATTPARRRRSTAIAPTAQPTR